MGTAIRRGLESHRQCDDNEMNCMDIRKEPQLKEDAQKEKGKMAESGEDDWDNGLEVLAWMLTWIPTWTLAWASAWSPMEAISLGCGGFVEVQRQRRRGQSGYWDFGGKNVVLMRAN